MRTLSPFVVLLPLACTQPDAPVDVAPSDELTFATETRTLDILFVVDNSGSMLEEQQALIDAFFELDPSVCPIADVHNVPLSLHDADGSEPELTGCGLLQLLSAFGYDWRVGVITTDVGVCDDRLPVAEGGAYCTTVGAGSPECNGLSTESAWGHRPQRGCLQPAGPPDSGAPKVLDAFTVDPAGWFRDTLANIRTFGSPWERGLDATELFLDPASARAPGCADDLEAFRRVDAELLVIALTDEDDCSRSGDAWVIDENANEVCGENAQFFTTSAQACYDDAASLPSASGFAERLLAREPTARVVVVGGAVEGSADGCLVTTTADPEDADGAIASDVCFPSGGLSNFTAADQPCGPGSEADQQGLACCTADPATRYEQFVDTLDARGKLLSICEPTLLPMVRDVALALIGAE